MDVNIVNIYGFYNVVNSKKKIQNIEQCPRTERISEDIIKIKQLIDLDYDRYKRGRTLTFSNVKIIYQYPGEYKIMLDEYLKQVHYQLINQNL